MERVILVDESDRALGEAEKLSTHRDGRLHRAFSVLVRNTGGDVLLQRRAPTKYHSAGLWANTCCGHPRPEEATVPAAKRRLEEEMGFTCPLQAEWSFLYRAEVGNGLIEHEYDHVVMGQFTGTPTPNADEVDAWRWAAPAALHTDLAHNPAQYAVWFRLLWAELERRAS